MMERDVTSLVGIRDGMANVSHVPYPHFGMHLPKPSSQEAVLFLGTSFRYIPHLDREVFIARTNKCLEYLRCSYPDCRLLYKPHPAETDEDHMLDLTGFEIVREKNIADTYLQEHRAELRSVFSIHSIASLTAYSLGLNSYLFLDYFRGAYQESLFQWYRQVCFTELPESAFIGDLTKEPIPNAHPMRGDQELIDRLQKLLQSKRGTVWFILQVSPLDAMLSVLRMVKELFPGRRVGLLLYRHHRWDMMSLDDIRPLFDEVHVFPRTFYSLQPRRLLQVFRLTRSVKNFPIGDEDVFIGFAGYELLENAFISYHSKSLRISFWTYRSFLVHQNTARNPFFKGRRYSFTPASYVYNKIILPLLGLHRVIFLKPVGDDRELYTIHRYQRPMNELYDHVFYLHA